MNYVNLYEAKTYLSSLVDQAAAGETVIIAKNGVPLAKLVAFAGAKTPRQPAHALGLTYIAPDFDAPDAEIDALFNGA